MHWPKLGKKHPSTTIMNNLTEYDGVGEMIPIGRFEVMVVKRKEYQKRNWQEDSKLGELCTKTPGTEKGGAGGWRTEHTTTTIHLAATPTTSGPGFPGEETQGGDGSETP